MDTEARVKRTPVFWFIVSLILAALPIISVVWAVSKTAVDVPFWDQWNSVPLMDKLFSGTLTLADIWTPYFEHILFFPRLIMLGLAYLTHWDVRYENWAGVVLAGVIFVLFIKMLLRSFAPYSKPFLILIPSVSLIVFSLTQYENWIVGADMPILVCLAFVTWGVYALTLKREDMTSLVTGLAAGIGATFSFGTGLAYWPVGAWIILQWRVPWKEKKKYLLSWIAVGIAAYGVFFYGIIDTRLHTAIDAILDPRTYLEYILIYIGRPITSITLSHIDLMIAGGLAGLFGFFTLVFLLGGSKVKIQKYVPYIAFGLFVVLNAFITGLGRSYFGLLQARASRYTSITNVFWIAILVFSLAVALYGYQSLPKFYTRFVQIIRVSAWGFFVFTSILLLASSYRSAREFVSFRERFLLGRNKLLSGETCIKELLIYGYPPCQPYSVNVLKRYHLSTFRGQ